MAGLCKGTPSARRGRGTRRTKDFCAVPRGGVGTAAHSWVRVLIATAQLVGLYKTQRAKQSESEKRGSGGEPPRARRTEGPTTPAPRSTGPMSRVGGQGLDEGRLRGGGAGSGQRRHSHAIAQGALAGASEGVCAIAQARACGPHRASATNQDVEGPSAQQPPATNADRWQAGMAARMSSARQRWATPIELPAIAHEAPSGVRRLSPHRGTPPQPPAPTAPSPGRAPAGCGRRRQGGSGRPR